MGRVEFFEEAASKQPREHPYRQKETRLAGHPPLAIERETAAGDDAMHVGMMRERRAPGVQDQGHPDACAQMPGIGGDGAQGLGGDLEEQPIDHRLVVIRDGADGRGQGEHHVVIVHRQQLGLPRLEPAARGTALALRAMPVAAGVVGDLVGAAAFAAQDMPAQRRAAALLDGRHDLELHPGSGARAGPGARPARGCGRCRQPPGRERPTEVPYVAGRASSGLITLAQQARWPRGYTSRWSPASCGRAAPG